MIEYSIDKIIGNEIFATVDKRIITMLKIEDIQNYWEKKYDTFTIGTYQLAMWENNIGTLIWTKRITRK